MKKSIYYFSLILFCLALYLPGISTIPMVDRDSANFAQATKQMVETGNYVQIRVQNKPRHLKPPGIYWLQAFVVKISHANLNAVWPYRVPSVFGALFATLLLFGLTEKILTPRVAFLAAALCAGTLFLVVESHLVVTDGVLLATMVAMQLALWRIYREQQLSQTTHWGWPCLFWVAMSLGVLIKGLTPLVALLTILALCMVERDVRWLKALKSQWGIPLLILLTLAWLIPLSIASHTNFLFDMVSKDLLPKLVSGQESHGQPPGYFAVIFPFAYWPASLFFVLALSYAWLHRANVDVKFWLCWWLPTWLFYEFIPTKLPEYVLPIYPALAILMAIAIYAGKDSVLSGRWKIVANAYALIWLGCSFILIGALNYVTNHFSAHIRWDMLAISILFLTAVISAVYFAWRMRWLRAAKILLASSVIFFAVIFQWVIPSVQVWWVSHQVTQAVQQTVAPLVTEQTPLIAVGYGEPSLVFDLGTQRVLFVQDSATAIQALKNNASHVILADQTHYLELKKVLASLTVVKQIVGFDYDAGRWVHLWLLKVN